VDPKSPWHDRRVRLAANYAIDRRSLNEAETLGASRLTGGMVPRKFEFALALEALSVRSRQASTPGRAGYPNASTPGPLSVSAYFSMGETVANDFAAVGIKTKLVTMERAAFQSAWLAKKLNGVCVCRARAVRQRGTRLAELVTSDAPSQRGADPESEALYKQQARELDKKKREALLHQNPAHPPRPVRFAPIGNTSGERIGPRVARASS